MAILLSNAIFSKISCLFLPLPLISAKPPPIIILAGISNSAHSLTYFKVSSGPTAIAKISGFSGNSFRFL